MATPSLPKEPLPERLFGFTGKHAGLLFGLVYGTGFLIVLIHHARFGLDTIEPFKPKIFSAGLLFLVFAGAPCMAMARTQGLFGLRRPLVTVVENARITYIKLAWALGFWAIAIGLRMASAILFTPLELIPRYPGWLFFLLYGAISVGASYCVSFDQRPVTAVLIEFLLFILGVLFIYVYTSREFFGEVTWFYLVGIGFLWMHSVVSHQEILRTYDWERQLFSIAGLILLFSVYVYGHISPAYGGGAPIRVELSFTHATAFSANTRTSGFLLDQDSHGYYLIHQPSDKVAHFIPRDAIAEIVFHSEQEGVRGTD